MKIKLILAFLLFGFLNPLSAQVTDASFEFQAYPTGLIPGFRMEYGFAQKNAVHFRIGAQFIDHRDLGVHQEEVGKGYGFTIGYNRYLKEEYEKWHFGVRNDFWFNTIDWKWSIGPAHIPEGTSEVFVLQPTAHLGYLFLFENGMFITPHVSFGFEVNVKTEGEPTGEGAIVLLGFNVGKRF